MASSEIEIVSESSEQKKSSSPPPPPPPPQVVISDVYAASAYGDLAALRKFVEEESASLSVPDGNGFYALQWAALNNFAHVVQYIIEHGGDVNATDKAMQTALHWSAVRGSVASADVLLLNGARVEAADVSGYRAAHVAAQYGQTAFLYFIMAKHHADHDAPDNEGRSPLHWAAYKGLVDTIRLLLFKDACSWKQDKEGCTPLHWAAIRGNMEACIILVHAGTKQELMVKDHVGFTPAEVASDKGHRHIAFFLSNANRPNNKCWWGGKACFWKVGDRGYAPILFCIVVITIILFLNSILYAPTLTKVTAVVGLWGWIAVSAAIVALVLLVRCSRKDPGYIKPSRGSDNSNDNEDPLLNIDLNNYSVWMGNWSQLCPTCKIVRPIRSKHCPACKHCVEQFDHHCPWISNCVGKRNKWDFCLFLFVGGLTAILGDAVAIQRVWTSIPVLRAGETWIHHMIVEHPGIVAFLFMDTMILMACLTLLSVQASQIARNVTTNELANSMRYGYLRGPDGRFRNPYDHGCQKNCVDFLVHGYTNDEIAWPPLERLHDNTLNL